MVADLLWGEGITSQAFLSKEVIMDHSQRAACICGLLAADILSTWRWRHLTETLRASSLAMYVLSRFGCI